MPRKKQTTDVQTITGLVSITMLAFLGYALTHYTIREPYTKQIHSAPPIASLTYSDTKSGLTFDYPSSYRVIEYSDATNKDHKIVTLSSTKAPTSQNTSPSLITFDITINALRKGKSALEWLQLNPSSHFDPSRSTYQKTNVEDNEIITYTWEKILPGISITFARDKTLVIASTTYENSNDAVLADFTNIAKTIHIKPSALDLTN